MQSRSRLKKNQTTQLLDSDSPKNNHSDRNHSGKNSRSSISPYFKHIPLLVLSLIFFFWCIQIFITKQPQDIANFLVHQLYLPLLFPFFLFVTFFTGFLTLNIKRGSVIALFTTLLLLFRLQQIEFAVWWIVPFLITLGISILLTKKPAEY